MSVSIASDYAVLDTPDVTFYYGYERHDPNDDTIWHFVADLSPNSSESRTITYSCLALKMRDRFDVVDGLLRGIGQLIRDGHLVRAVREG